MEAGIGVVVFVKVCVEVGVEVWVGFRFLVGNGDGFVLTT